MDPSFADCSGTAQAYFTGSKFAQLAETYGYVVLFPNSVSLTYFLAKPTFSRICLYSRTFS